MFLAKHVALFELLVARIGVVACGLKLRFPRGLHLANLGQYGVELPQQPRSFLVGEVLAEPLRPAARDDLYSPGFRFALALTESRLLDDVQNHSGHRFTKLLR